MTGQRFSKRGTHVTNFAFPTIVGDYRQLA
jgi:hypothetical protein